MSSNKTEEAVISNVASAIESHAPRTPVRVEVASPHEVDTTEPQPDVLTPETASPTAIGVPGTPSSPAETPFDRFLRQVNPDSSDEQFAKAAGEYIAAEVGDDPVATAYNVLVLFDETTMIGGDDDRIYSAVQSFREKKPVLLILHSGGGRIEPAYLISKVAREYSNGTFHVAVPRRAKSAATLICCGADVVHMGSMSELGPIDPQINNVPALGLKFAVQNLAELVKGSPAAAEMFASYLHKSLPPAMLGFHERVAESAVQYAERLLGSRNERLGVSATELAKRLVYEYKDHGFVIDATEAQKLFGKNMIRRNTDEYRYSHKVYQAIRSTKLLLEAFSKRMYHIGCLHDGTVVSSIPPRR